MKQKRGPNSYCIALAVDECQRIKALYIPAPAATRKTASHSTRTH